MSGSSFLALLGVWLAAIASPGPDIFQIMRVGARDRRAGIACALGIVVGVAFWLVASLLGLAALIQAFPKILTVLQLVGGSYLLYMGIGAVRAGFTARGAETVAAAPQMSPGSAFRLGVATNLSNPKAVLFFGAVFAQFVRPGMGWEWIAIILATLLGTCLLWFVGFAAAVSALAKPLARYGHVIDAVGGVVFIAVAMWMLVEAVT